MDEHRIIRVQKEMITAEMRYQLTIADIPERLTIYLKPRPVVALENLLIELEQLVGLQQVKQKMRSLINGIKVQKLRDPHSSFTPGGYLFTGHYGTGKSRVAELMGRIFYALGLLERGQVVEVERSDLMGSVREVVYKALNGVLFIDSAQQLMQHPQDDIGRDIIKTLLQELDKHSGKMSVILADTATGIQRLLQLYPALTSRFNVTFLFENYQANELLAIFEQMVQAKKLQLDEDVKSSLLYLFEQWQLEQNHLGNAHELRQLLEEMINQQNDRLIAENITDPVGLARLTRADLLGLPIKNADNPSGLG
jgi:stage V sporulation protein K